MTGRVAKQNEKQMRCSVIRNLCGFRPGRGTVDAIFIVRQIMEKACEKKIPLYFHFIDFKAAFDTILRKALWKVLKSIGVSSKIGNILTYMYTNTDCTALSKPY